MLLLQAMFCSLFVGVDVSDFFAFLIVCPYPSIHRPLTLISDSIWCLKQKHNVGKLWISRVIRRYNRQVERSADWNRNHHHALVRAGVFPQKQSPFSVIDFAKALCVFQVLSTKLGPSHLLHYWDQPGYWEEARRLEKTCYHSKSFENNLKLMWALSLWKATPWGKSHLKKFGNNMQFFEDFILFGCQSEDYRKNYERNEWLN